MTDQPVITVDGNAIPCSASAPEPDAEARRMVAEALRIGYRHLDTARIYHTRRRSDGVRDAIEAGHVARDDIWLTTKIWVAHFDREGLLKQARTPPPPGFTPDLLLLHWPKREPSFAETLGA
jgi:diketogulonate reductase-like aldo/keto reductase